VDCAAFLVWRLHDRGTRLRFVTQRFDRRVPEESTVYDVLRYLALVDLLPGAKLPYPDDRTIPVAISLRRSEAAETGWLGVDLPATAGDTARPTNA
jgi:hypothetical protein